MPFVVTGDVLRGETVSLKQTVAELEAVLAEIKARTAELEEQEAIRQRKVKALQVNKCIVLFIGIATQFAACRFSE